MATAERQAITPQWYNPDPQVDQVPELKPLIAAIYATQGDAQVKAIEAFNTELTKLAWFNVWFQADNTFFSTSGIKVQPIIGTMFPTLRQITKSS